MGRTTKDRFVSDHHINIVLPAIGLPTYFPAPSSWSVNSFSYPGLTGEKFAPHLRTVKFMKYANNPHRRPTEEGAFRYMVVY